MVPAPKNPWNVGYWILAIVAMLGIQSVRQATCTMEPVPYSQFEEVLAHGQVSEVAIGETTFTGTLKSPDVAGKTVIVANRVEPTLAERLSKFDVPHTRVVESTLLYDILSWVAPAAVLFAVWFFLIRRFADKMGGGMGGFMSIGKSHAKVYVEKNTGVTFADVAGVDEAKAELLELFTVEIRGLSGIRLVSWPSVWWR
jgi:cell division protease FtsH